MNHGGKTPIRFVATHGDAFEFFLIYKNNSLSEVLLGLNLITLWNFTNSLVITEINSIENNTNP